jgi:hypothetical protein
MAHPTPISTAVRPVRGVYEVERHDYPVPPHGARGFEIVDSAGRTIGFTWVIPEHADERQAAACWRWLDSHDPPLVFTQPDAALKLLR